MATRIDIKGDRKRFIIVHEEKTEIERRYADVDGGPILHAPVWGYGRHDPDPVMLRRDEITGMSGTADRGAQGVHLERPTPRYEID